MTDACARFRPRVDAWVDGEDRDPGLETHLRDCAACRAERDARASLKRALSAVRLPLPPRPFDRNLLAPARRTWWPAAAAAAILLVVPFSSIPGSVPDVVAATSRLHEEVLAGRVTLGDLGLRPSASRTEYPTGCPCPPDLGPAAPFVVYGRGDLAVSCLALEADRPRAASWRRLGPHTVLVRPRRGLLEIWISRMDRPALAAWLDRHDATEPGIEPLTLREFT